MSRAVRVAQVACLVAGCSGAGPDRVLERRIEEAAKGAGAVVRLADLTDFAWDRVHVFRPYATRDRIEAELGFAWPGADRSEIAMSDGIALLVFVKDRGVARYVDQPRRVDFAFAGRAGGFSPLEASFAATPRGDGALLMVHAREDR